MIFIKNVAENVETRFDAWNYELDKLLPNEKNKKVMDKWRWIS